MNPDTLGWLFGGAVVGVPALWVLHKIGKALVWIAEALAALLVLILIVALAIKYGYKLTRFVVTHPRSLATVLVGLACWYWIGWLPVAIVAGLVGIGSAVWFHRDRVGFDWWVGRRVRAWWLRWTLYQWRMPRWCARLSLVVSEPEVTRQTSMRTPRGTLGVVVRLGGSLLPMGKHQAKTIVPRVLRVQSGPSWDQVWVKVPETMIPEDWTPLSRKLASARKVERCAIREIKPNVISVDFLRRDVLVSPRQPDWQSIIAQDADAIDLHNINCGLDEYGQPLQVDLASLSELHGGESGAGKSSPMWAPHVHAAPAIASGRERLIGLDPKGVELAYAREVFDYYADTPEYAADLLEWVRDVLITERIEQTQGKARQVAISWECPLWVIEFDEVSHWTKFLTDKKLRDRIDNACRVILTQGRALGIVLRAYAQSPLKEDIPIRDLIPRRTALRTRSGTHTDAVLGDGAVEAGAWAHRIGEHEPGMAYRMGEGLRGAQRARYDYPSDDLLKKFESYVVAGRAQQQLTTGESQLAQ